MMLGNVHPAKTHPLGMKGLRNDTSIETLSSNRRFQHLAREKMHEIRAKAPTTRHSHGDRQARP
jgi:hypothetical protein